MAPTLREEQLYAPVKAFLEAQGYDVKSEVRGCDVVARRADEPPVIVELKRAFTLDLVLQGLDRLAMSDQVYLAVAPPLRVPGRRPRTAAVRLCRRVGLGLLLVHPERSLVEPLCDPGPYRPRTSRPRTSLLLREFARRVGDPNTGGQTRRPIVTAYRQTALRCAAVLERHGPTRVALLSTATGTPAGPLLRQNVYGWFERVDRGVYALSQRGRDALGLYADVVRELDAADG